ncbi:sperm motility kinase X-like [Megalobrama amblycephala]|uniref:sperm motility kinase X-like n=1 Tax=Megalobrama amblycephala TaxID=75352 RepID=UPI002013C480|nr:sperm motility kinase X-like [Megalobrama amblycephala]
MDTHQIITPSSSPASNGSLQLFAISWKPSCVIEPQVEQTPLPPERVDPPVYQWLPLVSRHATSATDLQFFHYAPFLHPITAASPQASGTRALPQTLIAMASPRSPVPAMSLCSLGSIGSASVGRPPVDVSLHATLAPPSLDSTPGQSKHLTLEIGLTLMANKGPSVPHIIKLLDCQDDTDNYSTVQNIRQVIQAANICCERGVFHRDVKPENLLVNPDTTEVKLIDFGCGVLMKNSAFKDFSGTKAPCPPEIKFDGRYHAKPMTVWSLGILLLKMVCRDFPTPHDLYTISAKIWTRSSHLMHTKKKKDQSLQKDPVME